MQLGVTEEQGRPDLPHSTRSVTDRINGRIYLPTAQSLSRDSRSPIVQAFASLLCGHEEPRNYADFLRQRVETNYLTAAILLPEADAVKRLTEAKNSKRISMEELRDAFAVSYETAAHRFTNLATARLGIPVHFMKVHESGTITSALLPHLARLNISSACAELIGFSSPKKDPTPCSVLSAR